MSNKYICVNSQEENRYFKLDKYSEIIISGDCFEIGLTITDECEMYCIGMDFSNDSKLFCGLNENTMQWRIVKEKEFDNYNIICRIKNWSKNGNKEVYYLRVLQVDKNDKVDFEEEKKQLESVVW